MQFAAPEDGEDVGVGGVLDLERDIGQELPRQALAQIAAGDVLAFLAGEWRGVDLELHRQRRLVDRDHRQRVRRVHRRDRRPDRQLIDAGNQHDVAGRRAFDRRALQPGEAEHLADLAARRRGIAGENHHFLPGDEAAAADPADTEPSDVARVVERADLQLQRPVGVAGGGGHAGENRFEQRPHVGARRSRVERRITVQRRGVDDRKIELVFARAEAVEQLERLIDHPFGAGTRSVDLVDHDDRLEALRQRFAGDKAGLRHRSLDRIDQQQHAVDHRQHALDLAAEVGVTGRVDDVDVCIAILDRAILGDDGDAALALDVVAVHHPLGDVLIGGKCPCLDQQLVDQRGLAVVDVGDDRDVAQLSARRGVSHAAIRVMVQCGSETVYYSRSDDSPRENSCKIRHLEVLLNNSAAVPVTADPPAGPASLAANPLSRCHFSLPGPELATSERPRQEHR